MLPDYIQYLESIKVDSIIVSDLGVFNLAKQYSHIPITISTQANNTNWASVKMWKELGAKRVILARELSLKEIYEIRQKVPEIELEVFIHGAMCISISGRCLLSNYLTGRNANRGECTQPCRWKYYLMEEKRPGEYFKVFEDERGSYIMNSKDLCTIEFLDKVIETGVDSLKIEGRMKSSYYAGITTKIYREAIDSYFAGTYDKDKIQNWKYELENVSHRPYTSGFYLNKPNYNSQNYETSSYIRNYNYVGIVKEKISDNSYLIDVKNKIKRGETIEIIRAKGEKINLLLSEIINYENNDIIEEANPNQKIILKVDSSIQSGDLIRSLKTNTTAN